MKGLKSPTIITLLTDFGTSDYFVSAMKGVVLSRNPNAVLVDITHEIPPHDVQEGAFNLLAIYNNFPPGTIHLAVVDPGVGSSRRPIIVTAHDYFFVGPDNGLFSYIYESEKDARIFHITNKQYFMKHVSLTFHGRDVFAPVAAALSSGVDTSKFGHEISDPVHFELTEPVRLDNGRLQGSIIHIDRFGNCVTNLGSEHLTCEMIERGASLLIKEHCVREIRSYYAEANLEGEELFIIPGSAGFLEIAAHCKSAACLLNVERGEKIFVEFD